MRAVFLTLISFFILSPLQAETPVIYSTEAFVFPGETQGVTLRLKPRDRWQPFFWGLADIPAELIDGDAYAWTNTLTPSSVCGLLDSSRLDRNDPAVKECLAKIRLAVEALFEPTAPVKRNYAVFYSTMRTFVDTATESDIDTLKNLLHRDSLNLFTRIEIFRGLYRLMGMENYAAFREALGRQSFDVRLAAALVWAQETGRIDPAERIALAGEAITHEKWWVRAKAMELLWKIPASFESEAMPLIEKGLADRSPEVRMRALQVLFPLNPEKAWPVLQMYYILERSSAGKDSGAYQRSVEILAGAVLNLADLYQSVKTGYESPRTKIIGYLMAEGAIPAIENINNQPTTQHTSRSLAFSALALWDAGQLRPIIGLYQLLDQNEDRSLRPQFSLVLARLKIGLLMDHFEKTWNSLLQDPDQNAWSLILYNEALAKAAQAPFAADQKRAQALVEKGLNSESPWLMLLAARAALIASVDTRNEERPALSKQFFFYHHDRKNGDNFGDFVVGWLRLKPEYKSTPSGFEVRLNPSVNWDMRGVFFGAGMLANSTKEILGKNGQGLIRAVTLLSPKGEWVEPLKDGEPPHYHFGEGGSVTFPSASGVRENEGWVLLVTCSYLKHEEILRFPIRRADSS
ncbi:MAG: HEAT repeat domain-containing protein [Candidatus Omnitrophica bacterium]|nr:HEAT repeat domain-containing protein [Candidatus Omnitrophota bacterium]